MPDIPAHRAARFVAQAIELAIDARITVCTPYAPDALHALTQAAPHALVDLVTHDLRTAEAAEAVRVTLPPETRDRTAIHIGDGPARAPARDPDIVLLWPSGWEGHARIRAQIGQALALLPAGGKLYLLAARQKGSAALLDLLRRLCGAAEISARGPGGLRLLAAVKQAAAPDDDRTDPDSETKGLASRSPDGVLLLETDVAGRHFVFRTAPGVFSHLLFNAGTRFFLDALESHEHETLSRCLTLLDLGCGYGPAGIILAALHPQVSVVLADVDSRAVDLAAQNAALNGLSSRVEGRLSDGLRHLHGLMFDAIVSHFPLHIPRDEQTRLLQESRDALTAGGQLYLCALTAYDLRPVLRAVFGHARTVAEGPTPNGDRYRVTAASRSPDHPLITLPVQHLTTHTQKPRSLLQSAETA